ncbi:MAG: hypothetical protein NZL85_05465 [Fimbriimonadales bacterium]|nr:hypothetical protein [Fimbriimonadales bacterium]
MAIGVAHGVVPRGVIPYEQSMSGHAFVREFLRRGFRIRETISHEILE